MPFSVFIDGFKSWLNSDDVGMKSSFVAAAANAAALTVAAASTSCLRLFGGQMKSRSDIVSWLSWSKREQQHNDEKNAHRSLYYNYRFLRLISFSGFHFYIYEVCTTVASMADAWTAPQSSQ